MNWNERIENYHRETGFPPEMWIGSDGVCYGWWVMGNDYRVKSGYYGGYPAGYLKRVKAIFPEKQKVLHLFSGRVDTEAMPGATVDINPANGPDYVDDAAKLEIVPLEDFDLVMSDPPYSAEDCEHYGTPMVNRNAVMQRLGERLTSGTHVCWLDQVLPMYRKDQFSVAARISMIKSTNHRFRIVTIFLKL